MTEEEIKAIEFIKKRQEFMKSEPECITTFEKNIDILLNLIEKQQKEIENLANGIKVLGTNPSITTEEIIEEFRKNPISKEYLKKFRKEHISKDKIRELREIDNIDLIQFKIKELLEEK